MYCRLHGTLYPQMTHTLMKTGWPFLSSMVCMIRYAMCILVLGVMLISIYYSYREHLGINIILEMIVSAS